MPRYGKLVWFLGIILMMLNAIVGMIVLPHVDMTLLSSVQATSIISGVLIGIFWLREPLAPRYDIPALSCMIIGCISLSFSSNKATSYYTMAEMKYLMLYPYAKLYYFCMGVSIVTTFFCYRWLMRGLARFELNLDTALLIRPNS